MFVVCALSLGKFPALLLGNLFAIGSTSVEISKSLDVSISRVESLIFSSDGFDVFFHNFFGDAFFTETESVEVFKFPEVSRFLGIFPSVSALSSLEEPGLVNNTDFCQLTVVRVTRYQDSLLGYLPLKKRVTVLVTRPVEAPSSWLGTRLDVSFGTKRLTRFEFFGAVQFGVSKPLKIRQKSLQNNCGPMFSMLKLAFIHIVCARPRTATVVNCGRPQYKCVVTNYFSFE